MSVDDEFSDETAAAAQTAPDTPARQEDAAEPVVEEVVPAEPSATAFRYDEKFYQPVSPESPTGSATEFYHFAEMDQELAWPQNEFGRPDSAQRPNFRAVRDKALVFLNGSAEFKATRDVRPMLALVIAEAGDKGPVGLAKALDLFVTTAIEHWDAIHPQKEDEDDDELMTRMEEMRKYMNPAIFSLAVESVALVRSPRVGDLTTRTFGVALTKLTPGEGEFAPNADAMRTLLSEEEEANTKIAEAHAAYRYAIDRLRALEAFLETHPDADPVDLASVAEALEKQVAFIAPFVGGAETAATETNDAGATGPDVPFQPETPTAPTAGVTTLEEATSLLDDILAFYASGARSSPVPLGLIALRDLMAEDFNAWINQTASAGLEEAALNLSLVDASRLSGFVGGAPAQTAVAVPAELDFSDVDAAIAEADTAFTALATGLYEHQKTLPASEDGEINTTLAIEIKALQECLDAINTARWSIEEKTAQTASDPESSVNAAEGDGHHSRIKDRSGVKQSLDAVAAYFEREEPSSPAPAYLRRLRSLVDARFSEIARELMPEGGGEAKLRLEPKTNLR